MDSPIEIVQILNEAGTAVAATGTTTNGAEADTVTVANVIVQPGQSMVVHSEYQIQVGAYRRRGMMCIAFNAEGATATYK